MQHTDLQTEGKVKKTSEYSQCTILWRNLPARFKSRWQSEAENFSMSGYRLFLKTNMNNLTAGNEIKIAPWH